MNVRELQHLAAAMAHEVRNPLNSMAIHLELLEGRLKRDGGAADREALLKSAAVLAGEIERVDMILDEYLQFAGPEEATRRPVEPAALLREVVQRERGEAEARGVLIEIEVAAEIGRWAVDLEELGEAVGALLANAVQASPRGAVVTVQARTEDDQGEIVVRDRGEGIAADNLARVFQLGFTTRGRAGVGLSVAKQIVKGHGGSLTVESAGAGAGAAFRVRLPIEGE
jgi:signal transduction histidine kinase